MPYSGRKSAECIPPEQTGQSPPPPPPPSVSSSLVSRLQPSNHVKSLLSPKRHELLSNYQCGVLSPSTPPVSRQRRHSKLHLRISSELSVDQGEGSSFGMGSSTRANSAIGGSLSSATTTTTKQATKDRYRIVIMGSSAVGKTAIVEQFLYGSFPDTHCATVEELHKGEYEIAGGGYIPLEILDTSGDAFALIYSIDNPESFEEVKNIREMILQVKGTESQLPPIVVVGNKTDLDEEKRQVKMELAECECIDWEHGFVECSAKKNQNIINIFSCMLIQARLNGTLNVAQIASSHSSRHIGYRDHSDVARIQQRRRSSLPISELFHRLPSGHSGRASQGATFRKRNSCTPQ